MADPMPQIGALIGHTVLFWGPHIVQLVKSIRAGESADRHYDAMRRYKQVPWWWFTVLLVTSFVFGLAVVLKDDIGLPAWGYIIALVVGTVVAPFVSPIPSP